jgi:hypothetical protein
MNKFTKAFQDFFAPLSSAQKAMFVGLTVAIVIFVGSLFYWALKPTYTLLFGSLQNESAQEIVQELDNRGVNYQLKNGGQSIYVPTEQVNELRIQLAPMGAPQSDMKGYELFDSNSLGMTDFMQQVNNRRALEGELTRTVNGLGQVAALATLSDMGYYRDNFRRILANRKQLAAELERLGFEVLPSHANFLLVRPPKLSARVWSEELDERKILVRWFNQPRLKHWLRITVGSEEEIEGLLKAVRQVLRRADPHK